MPSRFGLSDLRCEVRLSMRVWLDLQWRVFRFYMHTNWHEDFALCVIFRNRRVAGANRRSGTNLNATTTTRISDHLSKYACKAAGSRVCIIASINRILAFCGVR